MVSTLVMSTINYCNGLLVNAQNKVIHKLQSVQNAAARMLSGTHKYKPISQVIQKYHWLPVKNRIKFKALCIAYKAIRNIGPQFLIEKLATYIPNRALHSSNAFLLRVPRTKTASWGDKRFIVATAKLWNFLPLNIRS